MTEVDVATILQRALEAFPAVTPGIISDNASQFVARIFKAFIRLCGLTHARTSPHQPESKGKIEVWHKTLKRERIRPRTPLSLADTRRVVGSFVKEYNEVRLHSAIGYLTPQDRLQRRDGQIWADRERKLATAHKSRRDAHRAPASTKPVLLPRLEVLAAPAPTLWPSEKLYWPLNQCSSRSTDSRG